MRRIATLICCAALTTPILAQTADKRSYTFINPTPRELWRPLSADRPDFTESPITVDAGAFQLELSFFDYARNGNAESWSVAPTNLKVGLLNNVDVQLVLAPYVHEDNGTRVEDGFGDTQVRLKINLWGNDGGRTALGLMPFIKVPTATDDLGNNHVEGGLIVPFAIELQDDLGLGLMFETDFVFDKADNNYDTEFLLTGVVGFDISDEIGLYVEGIGITSTDSDTDFRGILGAGATYSLSANMVFDAGVNIGLTGDADDVNIFSGVTIRF